MITAASAMVKCLEAEGVEIIFGYPGAATAPFYNALSHSNIRHVLDRNEQAAGHAASGYARITGHAAVCTATSGPGATNLFTALATAYSDSIPMVAITGQVPTNLLGHDVFQEVDTTGAASCFTKHTFLVRTAEDIPRIFKEAFFIANSGRPGPVVIDVPLDVQEEMISFKYPKTVSIRGYKPRTQGHPLQVKKIAEAISAASRPLICAGGGVLIAGAKKKARELSAMAGIPCVSTMMGIGVFDSTDPLYLGMLGQCGTAGANAAVQESDLLVIIGARVGDRAIWNPGLLESTTTIVHIDVDSAEIGKNLGVTIPIVGDAGDILEKLCKLSPSGDFATWRERIAQLAVASEPKPLDRDGVEPAAFVGALCDSLPDDGVYVADVGKNQIWSAMNYRGKGRFLTTGGMGTMGYSIPAAVGASLAQNSAPVAVVLGDGAFDMMVGELATVKALGLPLKITVMKNGELGMIKRIGLNKYGNGEFAVSLDGSPSLDKLAAAYGIGYGKLESNENIAAEIGKMMAHDGPYLLECRVDPREDIA